MRTSLTQILNIIRYKDLGVLPKFAQLVGVLWWPNLKAMFLVRTFRHQKSGVNHRVVGADRGFKFHLESVFADAVLWW